MVIETRAWCLRCLHVNSTVHFVLYVNGESNNSPNKQSKKSIKLWTQMKVLWLKIQLTSNNWPNYSQGKCTVFLLHSVGMTNTPGGLQINATTNADIRTRSYTTWWIYLMRRKTAKHSISAQWHSRWSFREHNMGNCTDISPMLSDFVAEQQSRNFQKETATDGKNVRKKIIATGQDKGGQR